MRRSQCPLDMLAVDNVWGDRVPDGGIGPTFGWDVVVDDLCFFRAIDPREEAF